MAVPDGGDYAELGRQLGVAFRRLGQLHSRVRAAPARGEAEPNLERAAYLLLSKIASGGPTRLSDLAGASGLGVSTVSRQVAALEQAGLVGRGTDPADRRVSLITVSPAGAEVSACIRSRWHGTLQRLLADWTTGERAEFVRLLTRFNDALQALPAGDEPADRGTVSEAALPEKDPGGALAPLSEAHAHVDGDRSGRRGERRKVANDNG